MNEEFEKQSYRISVIIPNFNRSEFIKKAVDSALNQTYKPFEIIVVDDGSTDNSIEVLSQYGNSIRVLISPNYGASAARNLGIINATGDIIALLDSDDYWADEKLFLQISEMKATSSDLVYCQGIEIDSNGAKIQDHYSDFSGDCYKFFILNPTISIFPLPCSSVIFRKNLVARSGLFDTKFKNFAEDWDFFRRLSEFAKVGKVDKKLVFYVRHRSNSTNASLVSHFYGNKRAVRKVFLDNPDLSYFLKIRITINFYLVYFKNIARRMLI